MYYTVITHRSYLVDADNPDDAVLKAILGEFECSSEDPQSCEEYESDDYYNQIDN